MTGAAISILSLHDLSGIVGRTSGFKGAAVVDSGWGPIDRNVEVSYKTVTRNFGKTNPKKYGLSLVAARNALKGCNMVLRRVDKGQLYSSALVKAEIEPASYIDSKGFWIDKPNVDKVVTPAGALGHNDIPSYTFNQYPTKRIVKEFAVPVALTVKPKNDDVQLFVDNVAKVQVGDQIALTNTNQKTRAESLNYLLYKVTGKTQQKVVEHWIEVSSDVNNGDDLVGKEVKSYLDRYVERGNNPVKPNAEAAAGATTFNTDANDSALQQGEKIKFANHDKEYSVVHASASVVTITPALAVKVPANTKVFVKVAQKVSLQKATFVEGGWTPDKPRLLKVNDNDILLENQVISIDEFEGKIIRKFNVENYANVLDIQPKYVEQDTNVKVGSPVYFVDEDDFEHRDAFLVTSIYPGDEANKLSISISDSKVSADQFVLTVYWEGNQVESFECSRLQKKDGYGQQLFVEQVINNRSIYIRVKDNPDCVDKEGNPLRPLNTDYYLRQRISEPNYTKVAETRETVFDGDTKITVGAEYISAITIDKPFRIGGRNYPIVSLVASRQGGAVDTVQLGEPVKLGLDKLPLRERKLDPGAPAYQAVELQEKYKLAVDQVRNGALYSITVDGKEYSITSVAADSQGKPDLWDNVNEYVTDKTKELYWGAFAKGAITFKINFPAPQTTDLDLGSAKTTKDIEDKIETIIKGTASGITLASITWATTNISVEISKAGTPLKTITLNLTTVPVQNDAEYVKRFTREFIKAFDLANPANLDIGKTYNTAESILLSLKAKIEADADAPVLVANNTSHLVLTSKDAGTSLVIDKTGALTLTKTQEPAKDKITYPVETVNGSILPKATAGATVQDGDKRYYILDAGSNKFTGGFDNFYPTTGQFIKSLEKGFLNPDDTPDVIMIQQGGINSIEYCKAINRICKTRLDVLSALSVPFESQAASEGIDGELQYRSDLAINNNWSTLYTPWCRYYDTENDLSMWLSPDSFLLAALGYNESQGNLYKATAGYKRGQVDTTEVYKQYDYSGTTGGEMGVLYDNQINPIRKHKTRGIVFWGQKTLQVEASALDRLNTNLVVVAIFKELRQYLDGQTFEYNDAPTRARHQSRAESMMDYYKSLGAIEGYSVLCDESNNPDDVIQNHELYLDVQFWGKYTAERQHGRLVVTADGKTSLAGISL